METLKLQTNVPEIIALQFADGLPTESKYGGDQVMFTLTDGRRVFLAPFVARRIADAGIQPGELFEICKKEVVAGNRRLVEYQIKTDIRAVRTGPAASKAPVTAHVPTALKCDSFAATVAASTLPAAGTAQTAALEAPAITAAGYAAIDAVLAVERYAQSKGLTDFSFGAENIQKVWLTLYIDARKGGRA